MFGPQPGWWPAWLPFSPAILILWAPAGFRVTCYYYRGAYYKAFWADPPSCAVGEPRNAFRGENSFPLILQNIHRYFLYLAIGFVVVLSYDAWAALWFEDAAGGVSFGIGVGSLVLALNAVLICPAASMGSARAQSPNVTTKSFLLTLGSPQPSQGSCGRVGGEPMDGRPAGRG